MSHADEYDGIEFDTFFNNRASVPWRDPWTEQRLCDTGVPGNEWSDPFTYENSRASTHRRPLVAWRPIVMLLMGLAIGGYLGFVVALTVVSL